MLEWLRDLDIVNWMAVGEAHRRRGLASRLYAVLEREARACGMKLAVGHGGARRRSS